MIERIHQNIGGQSGAEFSDCERYRYRLWREWDASKPTICFCMLNPSTADELANDPTVERCQRRAIDWGFGRLEVVNIFAWRSTDPKGLIETENPEGNPYNDEVIIKAASRANMFICGWGKHGHLNDRHNQVMKLLDKTHISLHALRINVDCTPGHPLYIGHSVKPFLIYLDR